VVDLVANAGTRVSAFTLNYQLPMSCIMTSGNMSHMGRCAIGDGDMRLHEDRWQAPLAAAAPSLPVFQDTAEADVWGGGFGGGHDDLLVYDRDGRLFAHLPSAMSVAHPLIEQDLLTTTGFDNVRTSLLLAAVQPTGRCVHSTPSPSASWSVTVLPWILLALAAVTVCGLCWAGKLRWRSYDQPRVMQTDGRQIDGRLVDGPRSDVHHGDSV